MDAVPGRLNSLVIQLYGIGIFFGQCSELCGAGHGFMPIKIEVFGSLKDFYFSILGLYLDEFSEEF